MCREMSSASLSFSNGKERPEEWPGPKLKAFTEKDLPGSTGDFPVPLNPGDPVKVIEHCWAGGKRSRACPRPEPLHFIWDSHTPGGPSFPEVSNSQCSGAHGPWKKENKDPPSSVELVQMD